MYVCFRVPTGTLLCMTCRTYPVTQLHTHTHSHKLKISSSVVSVGHLHTVKETFYCRKLIMNQDDSESNGRACLSL